MEEESSSRAWSPGACETSEAPAKFRSSGSWPSNGLAKFRGPAFLFYHIFGLFLGGSKSS